MPQFPGTKSCQNTNLLLKVLPLADCSRNDISKKNVSRAATNAAWYLLQTNFKRSIHYLFKDGLQHLVQKVFNPPAKKVP